MKKIILSIGCTAYFVFNSAWVHADNSQVDKSIQMLNAQIQVQFEKMHADQQAQMQLLNKTIQAQLAQLEAKMQTQMQTLNTQTQNQIKQVNTNLQIEMAQLQKQQSTKSK